MKHWRASAQATSSSRAIIGRRCFGGLEQRKPARREEFLEFGVAHDRPRHQRQQQRIVQRREPRRAKQLRRRQPRRPGLRGARDERAQGPWRISPMLTGANAPGAVQPSSSARSRKRRSSGSSRSTAIPETSPREHGLVLGRRTDLDAAHRDRERLAGLAAIRMRHREVEIGVDETWLQRDRAAVMVDRIGVASGFCERQAEAVVGRRRLRLKLHGGAVLRDRFVEAALPRATHCRD